MIKTIVECIYCGNRWKQTFYSKSQMEDLHCNKCNDSSLKFQDYTDAVIDQYADKPKVKKEKKDV